MPAAPAAGIATVTQLAPESRIAAAAPPTSTFVIAPKWPLVIVTALPPAKGPALVDSWNAEPINPKL